MAQSRYSLPRLEKLLGKVIAHSEGQHRPRLNQWSKTHPGTRGKVVLQKLHLSGKLQSRINKVRTTQRKP